VAQVAIEDGVALQRLVDTLIPRDTAERALNLYGRYLLQDGDAVYALQRAAILIGEELGWHRHWRGKQ
jgi:hypothetical protein